MILLMFVVLLISSLAGAQDKPVTNTSILSSGVLVEGTKDTSTSIAIVDDQSTAKIVIDRSNFMDVAARLSIAIEISEDGGKTWTPMCSGITSGGPLTKDKTIVQSSMIMCPQLRMASNRNVRTVIEVLKGTANIAADVETK